MIAAAAACGGVAGEAERSRNLPLKASSSSAVVLSL